MFWFEWAAFNFSFKGKEKSLRTLAKGIDQGAEPASIMECLRVEIEVRRCRLNTSA